MVILLFGWALQEFQRGRIVKSMSARHLGFEKNGSLLSGSQIGF